MSPLLIECLISPPLETNTYLVADSEAGRAIAIDPSCVGEQILERCRENNWKLDAIVLTHSHIDHVHDTALLARETGAPVLAHKAAATALKDPIRSGAAWLGMDLDPCEVSRTLAENDTVQVGGIALRVLHLPGHSPCSICLLGEGCCFGGDLLFRDGVGRWDLPGGNEKKLIASLRRLASECGDDVTVYPGHGPATTMGRERRKNSFLLEWL
jgi:glyoxylase-like metal-dependent hydrolase (beta-lactamase superfamily II)